MKYQFKGSFANFLIAKKQNFKKKLENVHFINYAMKFSLFQRSKIQAKFASYAPTFFKVDLMCNCKTTSIRNDFISQISWDELGRSG